jgi:Arc/MetJ family transcription regulator
VRAIERREVVGGSRQCRPEIHDVEVRGAPYIPTISMIWETHMKTTIEISDALLRRAKKLAARRGTTLKAVIEDALRAELAAAEAGAAGRSIRTHTFGGRGLKPGLAWGDWAAIRALAYEGRGG